MIEIPEGAHVVLWCSLYCEGNEATGDLNIEARPGEFITLPICDECKKKIEARLDRTLGAVLE